MRSLVKPGVIFLLAGSLLLSASSGAHAHCDTLDGPVVGAARKALEAGDVTSVLIWVQKANEEEIRHAFQETLAVRKLSPEARQLADRFFFETLVRVHRAVEGAPFTGLKPAGQEVEPGIAAADKAVEQGSLAPVQKLLAESTKLETLFGRVKATKAFAPQDTAAGREHVKAYVTFMHYVEGLFEAANRVPEHHAPAADAHAEPASAHEHH